MKKKQSNQTTVAGLGSSYYYYYYYYYNYYYYYYYKRLRVSACDGEVSINQNALNQVDRMAYICAVASLS